MKRLLLLVATLFVLMACSALADNPAPSSAPPEVALTPDPAQARQESASRSSEVASASSARTAVSAETDKFMESVRAQVDKHKKGDIDGRLSEIVTAYCTLLVNQGVSSTQKQIMQTGSNRVALSQYYNQLWHSGGKWNLPLYAAAQQPGGCKTLATATNTPGG
jgi:hypothetical protein